MGCSSNKNTLTNTIVKTDNCKFVQNFDKDAVEVDLGNKPNEYKDFIKFCTNNEFKKLEYLNLSKNNISDLSELRVLKAPRLKKLDLSNNQLNDIDDLKNLNFPLEELYIEGNNINSIEFDEPFLKKLKKLKFGNNINYTEKNNEIIEKQLDNVISTLQT